MYRPNSIKTLMSMKKEKEERLTKSLSLFEPDLESVKNEIEDSPSTFSDPEPKSLCFPNLEQIKVLLKAVDETLQNLRTWKKAEKLEFERQIKNNEQKIATISQGQADYQENLEKAVDEMEEIQRSCNLQVEKFSKKFNKEEISLFVRESEESFQKIKETNQKLENMIFRHQNLNCQSFETDIQRQFLQNAFQSLNLEKLTKSLNKWHEGIDRFYEPKEIGVEENVNLRNMEKINLEKVKVQEKQIEDSKVSEKIKNEIEEIDKELEELESMFI